MGKARRARDAAKALPRSTIIFPAMTAGPIELGRTRDATMRKARDLAGKHLAADGDHGWRIHPASEVFAVLPDLFGPNPSDYERQFMARAYDYANRFPQGNLVVAFVEAHLPAGWHDDSNTVEDMPWTDEHHDVEADVADFTDRARDAATTVDEIQAFPRACGYCRRLEGHSPTCPETLATPLDKPGT